MSQAGYVVQSGSVGSHMEDVHMTDVMLKDGLTDALRYPHGDHGRNSSAEQWGLTRRTG